MLNIALGHTLSLLLFSSSNWAVLTSAPLPSFSVATSCRHTFSGHSAFFNSSPSWLVILSASLSSSLSLVETSSLLSVLSFFSDCGELVASFGCASSGIFSEDTDSGSAVVTCCEVSFSDFFTTDSVVLSFWEENNYTCTKTCAIMHINTTMKIL